MEVISKVYRYRGQFNLVVVDGEMYVIAQEVASYINRSTSFVVKHVPEKHKMVLRGRGYIKGIAFIKSTTPKLLLITLEGLKLFSKTLTFEKDQIPTDDMIRFIQNEARRDMQARWDDHLIKSGKEKEEKEFRKNQGDLFNLPLTEEVAELKKRVEFLESRIKELEASKTISFDNKPTNMVDLNDIIATLQRSARTNGHV